MGFFCSSLCFRSLVATGLIVLAHPTVKRRQMKNGTTDAVVMAVVDAATHDRVSGISIVPFIRELRETQTREQQPVENTTPVQTRTQSHQFVVGDRVVIANNYRRQRNIQGTVL
jgi:hypothetical protein